LHDLKVFCVLLAILTFILFIWTWSWSSWLAFITIR